MGVRSGNALVFNEIEKTGGQELIGRTGGRGRSEELEMRKLEVKESHAKNADSEKD